MTTTRNAGMQGCRLPAMGVLGLALALIVPVFLPARAEEMPPVPKLEGEKKQICEEAEARYRKIYGHPSADLLKKGIHVVKMYKYTFCPPSVTIRQGETVRWVNVDKRTSHSVWFRDEGKEESERIFPDPEEKVEMTFDLPPGEYPYLCGPHWQTEGMVGKVIVQPGK